jgi:hypothetical protein
VLLNESFYSIGSLETVIHSVGKGCISREVK